MSLQCNRSAGWIEFASGAVCGALHVVRLGIVNNGLVIELHGDVLALDGDADSEPLGLIERRSRQVHYRIEATCLALFLLGGVELHLVIVGQMVLRVGSLVIGVEKNAGIGVRLASCAQLQNEAGKWDKLSLGLVADVKEMGAFLGGVGANRAVHDRP